MQPQTFSQISLSLSLSLSWGAVTGWGWIMGAPSALQGGENLHGAGQGRAGHGMEVVYHS